MFVRVRGQDKPLFAAKASIHDIDNRPAVEEETKQLRQSSQKKTK